MKDKNNIKVNNHHFTRINTPFYSRFKLALLLALSNFHFSYGQDMDMDRYHFNYKKLIPATIMIGTGIAINGNQPQSIKNQIKDYRNNAIPNFRTHIDDYLVFTPGIAAWGLEFSKYKSRTNVYDKAAIYIKSQAINYTSTQLLKHTIRQLRPDGSNDLSTPSGHTSFAFSNATFLAIEYKDELPWIPYASYGIATSVGLLRIANNKHYLSDVLIGAAIGILSTQLTYWTHQYKWEKLLGTQNNTSIFKP